MKFIALFHILFAKVYPTQTVYVFERDGVRLTLTVSFRIQNYGIMSMV